MDRGEELMARKTSGFLRVFQQYHNVDIRTISLIQALEKNKDAKQIKIVLNKPNLSDNTALAYGRLANQYINALNQPNRSAVALAKKKYNVALTQNYKQNLSLMGNYKIKRPPLPPLKFPDVLQLAPENTLSFYNGHYFTSREVNTLEEIYEFFQSLAIDSRREAFIKQNGIKKYQLLLKIRFDNGIEGWISTKRVNFPNLVVFSQFYKNIEGYIATQVYYEWEDTFEVINQVIEMKVKWY